MAEQIETPAERRRREQYEKMGRYRRLAQELDVAAHELEGSRSSGSIRDAAHDLRDQAAAIARRLDDGRS